MESELERSFARMGLAQSPLALTSLCLDVTVISEHPGDPGTTKTSSAVLAKHVPGYISGHTAAQISRQAPNTYKVGLPMRPLRWIINAFHGRFAPIILDTDADLILGALAFLDANIDIDKLCTALFPDGVRIADANRLNIVLAMPLGRIRIDVASMYARAAFGPLPISITDRIRIATPLHYLQLRSMAVLQTERSGQQSAEARSRVYHYDVAWLMHHGAGQMRARLDEWVTTREIANMYENAFDAAMKQLGAEIRHQESNGQLCSVLRECMVNCHAGGFYAHNLACSLPQ